MRILIIFSVHESVRWLTKCKLFSFYFGTSCAARQRNETCQSWKCVIAWRMWPKHSAAPFVTRLPA